VERGQAVEVGRLEHFLRWRDADAPHASARGPPEKAPALPHAPQARWVEPLDRRADFLSDLRRVPPERRLEAPFASEEVDGERVARAFHTLE
jgi:hypothetical protein